jgi:hypothetical protein
MYIENRIKLDQKDKEIMRKELHKLLEEFFTSSTKARRSILSDKFILSKPSERISSSTVETIIDYFESNMQTAFELGKAKE